MSGNFCPSPRSALAAAPVPGFVQGRENKISVRNLSFYYGATQALKSVSLDIPEHQVTGMIGPSGCGKSTLLRVLNRLYDLYPGQRATGEVRLDGEDILGCAIDVKWLRRRVGMVFQASTSLPMSIHDNIAFGINVHRRLSRRDLDDHIERALTRAALWPEVKDRLGAAAVGLSVGQQQRLCIARALATEPDVLLLDEPTSALDPRSLGQIEDLIGDLKTTMTLAIVTHNMEQARRCADRVAFFYLGEVIEVGSVEDIFGSPRQRRTQDYVAGRFG